MGRVTGKVAIVTGAGSGMGRAHSCLLAKEGARVLVTDRHERTARETVALIEAAGGAARSLRHDVSSEADWQTVIADVLEEFGQIDVLVNNAGIGMGKPVVETSLTEWDLLQSVNARGTFVGCREVIPAMIAAGGGSIINVSSTWGLVGRAGFSAYCASKGAVRMLTKALAAELAPQHIRVNSVHPGTIETNLTKPHLTSPEAVEMIIGPQLIRRVGVPEEVSNAVLFLASDESSFVTGADVVVDGGYTAV